MEDYPSPAGNDAWFELTSLYLLLRMEQLEQVQILARNIIWSSSAVEQWIEVPCLWSDSVSAIFKITWKVARCERAAD